MKKLVIEIRDELLAKLSHYCIHVVEGDWLDDLFWQIMFPLTLLLLTAIAVEWAWYGVGSGTAWFEVLSLLSAILIGAFVLISVVMLDVRYSWSRKMRDSWKNKLALRKERKAGVVTLRHHHHLQ